MNKKILFAITTIAIVSITVALIKKKYIGETK